MTYKKLYKPQMTLKEVVIELAGILAQTNPGYKEVISSLIEEMEQWGQPEQLSKPPKAER